MLVNGAGIKIVNKDGIIIKNRLIGDCYTFDWYTAIIMIPINLL